MNLTREKGDDPNVMLMRYGIERLLYRISQSKHSEQFALKGAMLFTLWGKDPYRPTRDLDLLGYGDNSPERLKNVFEEICKLEVEDDGLTFDSKSVRVQEIKENNIYHGQRIKLECFLGNAAINLQVDIGFGDAVTEKMERVTFPTLFDFPAPKIRAYPLESVISEKLHAMIVLGMSNSRMKDFYDIWMLSNSFSFDGEKSSKAIRATFLQQKTDIPQNVPIALSDEFANDDNKARMWKAFTKRHRIDNAIGLSETIKCLKDFLLPLLSAISSGKEFKKQWNPRGQWE